VVRSVAPRPLRPAIDALGAELAEGGEAAEADTGSETPS